MPVPHSSPQQAGHGTPTPAGGPSTGAASGRLSIGAVLAELSRDFPDLTISKIRFLEAEGLIAPQRSGTGYRRFSPADLERLRYILTAQRDRFWPLKVIREALDKLERGLEPAPSDVSPSHPQVPAAVDDPELPTAFDLGHRGKLRLTDVELQDASGLDKASFDALSTYGLLRPDPTGHYGDAALAVARAAGALAAYGIEPRHLRPFRTAADREIGLVQQVVSPIRGRNRGTGGTSPRDPTPQILAECIALHTALVKAGLAGG
jgi:DNA-binding transcriptional MerR regulator